VDSGGRDNDAHDNWREWLEYMTSEVGSLADLRRQSRRVAKSPDTRVELLAMREESARLGEERIRAYAELVELIGLSEMTPEHMGLA
jgi:hypothetical protein